MPNILRKVKLNRIDLVDAPANPGATVMLVKREEGVSKKIRERNGKFEVTTEDGSRVLGTHDSHADAAKQLAAIEAQKHNAQKDAPGIGAVHVNRPGPRRSTYMTEKNLMKRFREFLKAFPPPATHATPADGSDLDTPGSEDHEQAEMGHINALAEMHKAMTEHLKGLPAEHPMHAMHKALGEHIAAMHKMNGAQFPEDNQDFAEGGGAAGAHEDVHMSAADKKEVEKAIAKRTEDLQKRLEAAEASLKAADVIVKGEVAKRELGEVRVELAKFANLTIDIEKEAPEYLILKQASPKAYESLVAKLAAANEQAKLAKKLEDDLGSGIPGGPRPSAWKEIEAKAAGVLAKSTDSKMTKAQAIDKVMQDPENFPLVKRYYEEEKQVIA
jgi:hypothetical protein